MKAGALLLSIGAILLMGCGTTQPEPDRPRVRLPGAALELDLRPGPERVVLGGGKAAGLRAGDWVLVRRTGSVWGKTEPIVAWLRVADGERELEATVSGQRGDITSAVRLELADDPSSRSPAPRDFAVVTVRDGLSENPVLDGGAVDLVTAGHLYGALDAEHIDSVFEVVTTLEDSAVAERTYGTRLPIEGDRLVWLGPGAQTLSVLVLTPTPTAQRTLDIVERIADVPGVAVDVAVVGYTATDGALGCQFGASVADRGRLVVFVDDASGQVGFAMPDARVERPGVDDALGCVSADAGVFGDVLRIVVMRAAGVWELARYATIDATRSRNATPLRLLSASLQLEVGDETTALTVLADEDTDGARLWRARLALERGEPEVARTLLESITAPARTAHRDLLLGIVTEFEGASGAAWFERAQASGDPVVAQAAGDWLGAMASSDRLGAIEGIEHPATRAEIAFVSAIHGSDARTQLLHDAASDYADAHAWLEAGIVELELASLAQRAGEQAEAAERTAAAGVHFHEGRLYALSAETLLEAAALAADDTGHRLEPSTLLRIARQAFVAANRLDGVADTWALAARILATRFNDLPAAVDAYAAASFYSLRAGDADGVARAELRVAQVAIEIATMDATAVPQGAQNIEGHLDVAARFAEATGDTTLLEEIEATRALLSGAPR